MSSLSFGSLGGAVFAALPLILSDSGRTQESTWSLASGAFFVYTTFLSTWVVRQRFSLPPETLESLHPAVWLVGTGGIAVASLALLGNAMGWPATISAGPYLFSLLFLLVLSCVLFVRLLLIRPGSSERPDTSLTL